ncbi:hypothetical protein BH10PLA1_BH10PLA1_08860 [soil metagenome]
MKKLFTVIMFALSLNFLVVAGGVGWLAQTKKLNKESVAKIKEILFPLPVVETPATQPVAIDPTTQPTLRLEELLAKKSGQTATEQVQFIQQAFDSQSAVLDRRQRELLDQQGTITRAKTQLAKDREDLERERQDLSDKQAQATKLADDKGFQDSLALYNTMPGKQVKTIFMTLDDTVIQQYLQAMNPRNAGRIVKEFKSPEETARIQKVLERMRQAEASAATANTPAATPGR